jgi:hypothetical protein
VAITPRLVLLLVAIVLFVLAAALPTQPTRIGLTPAGLAFLAAALLVGGP